MIDSISIHASQDAIEWALTHGMVLKNTPYSATHTAFSFTPTSISRERYAHLTASVNLLGKLVHFASENHAFLHQAISPITSGDPFFNALLIMHKQIHDSPSSAKRLPLLLMRSDFMDDTTDGPRLIEFNGIAAGMGPFGQKVHQLHKYLQLQSAQAYSKWGRLDAELVDNPAIERLSLGIATAAQKIKSEFDDAGPAVFLMVVQADEDNVFDQHLLEHALQAKGNRTVRRTFRQLHGKLSTGVNDRLILEDVGAIDTIYLRAGYQYCDYQAHDLISKVCCDALMQTRIFIEKHRVAVNATVSQQLATSKRVQMLLSSMTPKELTAFGLSVDEAMVVSELLGEMVPITEKSATWIKQRPTDEWVLKNQGEGGGHCIFGDDIHQKLLTLQPNEYQAWSLMRRLHPAPRSAPALTIRKGELLQIDDLISEIGMFTVHIDGIPATTEQGYAGYLIRSKSARATEGGVHSGMGVLDSLAFSD
ncbi:glutathione synthase [Shewanella sp. GutCb]|uniref:glutathione synthase n=1 Tax=Shewanella sp. GutCb TaxID=2058315 RepID=UPI000C7C4CA5|nr:glutathione synthase [Shewanella sp. GutCb]PKG76632.1 glutathione synthase [Shewanella sp. GutCb]